MTERSWTVVELIRWTAEYLQGKGLENPRLNAELLLSGVLGLKRLDLYLQFDRPLSAGELAAFKSRLLRRARREPLQYIEGEAAFRTLRLQVDPRVLIPRPETEYLVEKVLHWARRREGLDAVDVGTGSGAIALSLACEGAFRRVVATDLSADALDVARTNCRLAAPPVPVEFRQGSLLDAVAGERFDILVSNPPYVGEEERPTLDAEVRDWEPATALFAGPDGLGVLKPLVAGSPEALRPGGLLAVEIGHRQGAAVADLVRATARFEEPRVIPDLSGRERMVLAELR
jgi:release factor glutamine methyltransferase